MAYQLFIVVCAWLLGQSAANPIQSRDASTEFVLLHTNDMHARFDQTNNWGTTCTPELESKKECYGGFARVASVVRQYRKEAQSGGTPTIYLDAGDVYTGTAWFTIHKYEIVSAFMNKLQPDAGSLGNHEFDKNVEGLAPYLKDVNFPIVASNVDFSDEPELAAIKTVSNYTILDVNGVKIGVIGYLTPDTKKLALNNKVQIYEEITAINEVASTLKAEGIKIIIALGHSGYKKDQMIAAMCPEIDIVVGGHSHTRLEGDNPTVDDSDTSADAIRGPYPTVVVQSNGKKVPVVQAYAYTKFLGKLTVKFDDAGNLISWTGAPILLDSTVSQDQDFLDLLEEFRPKVTEAENTVVGTTKVLLEGGSSCRLRECNLGNLVADSMIHARVMEQTSPYWTDAAIALVQGGGVRTTIEVTGTGAITGADILTILPFENSLFVTEVTGKALKEIFEISAGIRDTDSNGGFLQYSGVQVVYDYGRFDGDRVTSIKVRCAQCNVPIYSDLKLDDRYKVIVQEYLLTGGDGYSIIDEENPNTVKMEKNDQAALVQYLAARQYVYPAQENRIIMTKSSARAIIGSVSLVMITTVIMRFFN